MTPRTSSEKLSDVASPSEGEWRRNWPLLLAAMVGISFVSVPTASLGLFMAPLQSEFGWSRAEISGGLTIFALATLPLMPVAGVLVDRFGPRRVALPGLIAASLAFAAFATMDGSLVKWFGAWVIFTIMSVAISIMVWTAAVSAAFERSRGLALALVLCGSALAQGLAPIAARALIEEFGWRIAYIGIAAGWGGSGLLLAMLFFHDRRKLRPQSSDINSITLKVEGFTVREALRSPTMYRIAFATFLQTVVSAAVLVHFVPLLTSIGLSRAQAASFGLILAVASVTGKLLTGWLIDRAGARWLPSLCYGGPAISLCILLTGSNTLPVVALAVAIHGYSAGAALQLTTYLTTRYCGLANFATIFGIVSMLMALAGGIGPLLGGAIFDETGGYQFLLIGGTALCFLAGFAVFGLGGYGTAANARSQDT